MAERVEYSSSAPYSYPFRTPQIAKPSLPIPYMTSAIEKGVPTVAEGDSVQRDFLAVRFLAYTSPPGEHVRRDLLGRWICYLHGLTPHAQASQITR